MLANKLSLISSLVLLTSLPSLADNVDLAVIHNIKDQAFNHSKVMDYVHLLADENGSRVTGSPGYTRAANSAITALNTAGISKAALEPWGVFGRGWDWSRIALQMKLPHETTLTAFPADWSAASQGPVSGSVIFAPLWDKGTKPKVSDLEKTAQQIEVYKEKYRGKIRGQILMIDHPVLFKLPEEPEHYRYDDRAIAELGQANEPGIKPTLEWPLIRYSLDKGERERFYDSVPLSVKADRWIMELKLSNRLAEFWNKEGVAAILKTTSSEKTGVIMNSDFGSFRDGDPIPPPTAVVMPEHYNRLHRLLERDVPVSVEVDIDAKFYGPAVEGINVIASIPGARKNSEVVMLGAHLDSWHGATGATDNAAGSAVVMEVMRILKTLNLKMKREVRAALWDGEEQGLFGSRAYVAKHFAEPVKMSLRPDHSKLSAYFNLDNGGGKIRGVYLQGNDMARPILSSWLAPFADLGVTEATIKNTHDTDHESFDEVGLPGFNFIQDPLDYFSTTHHSNIDDVGHIVPGDLMQAAAVMATAVYQAAIHKTLMPRKPLPKALPSPKPLPEILK